MEGVPAHLPERLAICCWIWSWITAATPGEPYDDLDRAMAETRDRGFNTVRVDAGLNWAFRADGEPRGPVDFGPWIAGYGRNFSTVNVRGGGRHDVLERLNLLFEAARRHDMRVILTSWEYQDSSWFLADPALRAEVYGIPMERRFHHLAAHLDRLLSMLEERGLDRYVAFVEIHNEPEYSDLPGGPEGVRLHGDAIAWLRERRPNVLVSSDHSAVDYGIAAAGAQVFDHHVYAGGAWYFEDLFGTTVLSPAFDPAHPRALETMRRILRDDLTPWDEFMVPAQNVRPFWRPIMWMFENLDNDRWDAWVAERFEVWEDRIRAEATRIFTADGVEARRRGLPAVMDEGGFFYPPRLSRFETSPKALTVLDLFTDLALREGYWGLMPGTYCGPEHVIWHENPDWLRAANGRFLAGRP